MNKMNRRSFLKSSLLAATTASFSARSWSQVAGANESIRVATVGFHGRGQSHIDGMRSLAAEGVKMVALCDVDSKVLSEGLASAERHKEKVDGYSDLRKLYERKDVDAITIATPNHWHALAAVWAIQAGKDVYVEKPVSHEVWEGRKIVEAARKYNKIVQTGTQSRSSQAIKDAVEWVRAGNLGKIIIGRGLCYKPRLTIEKTEGPQPIPDTIDYDLWCGPAPKDPLRRAKLHYEWHWFWNYGNGDLGNQGIHQMDITRWFLGEDRLSPRVFSVGARLGYKDDGETPNTQIVYHDYDKAPLIFEVRGLPKDKASQDPKKWKDLMDKYKGASIGVIIECEGGYVTVPNYSSAKAFDKEGKEIKAWKDGPEKAVHFDNFISAVKSRNYKDLHADIWEGHLSSALCHTGNISYRLGQKMSPDEIREKVKGDRGAMETFDRMAQHLAANDIDIKIDKLTLGEHLVMDPKVERFFGNKDADALLRREYRKPFVLPDKV